jgi:hypothetical protein
MIDQKEEQLGKLRGYMAEEMATGSGEKAVELYNKAEKCKIELNNYQQAVDQINEKHLRRAVTPGSQDGH